MNCDGLEHGFLFAAQIQILSLVLGVMFRAISTCHIKWTGFTVASGAKTGVAVLWVPWVFQRFLFLAFRKAEYFANSLNNYALWSKDP